MQGQPHVTKPEGEDLLAHWIDYAACKPGQSYMFALTSFRAYRIAKETCAGCPVREQCLARAQRLKDVDGTWGGRLFKGGKDITPKEPVDPADRSLASGQVSGVRIESANDQLVELASA